MTDFFPNLAGKPDIDDACAAELEQAGIVAQRFEFFRDQHPEVKTCVRGELQCWFFTRYWYYWAAKGPGIPPAYAMELHSRIGKKVRVEGHCCAPSPLEWCGGFAVGSYHIDNQEGLNEFAKMLNKIAAEAKDVLEVPAGS